MTREEAIIRLKNMAWLYGSAEREQNIEAIDMAISALQAPTIPEDKWDAYLDELRLLRESFTEPSVSVESKATENKYDCDLISRTAENPKADEQKIQSGDLISRADAIKVICDIERENAEAEGFNVDGVDYTDIAEAWLEDVPSVSAERSGEWIIENVVLTSNPPQYRWHCSECKCVVFGHTDSVCTTYCPSCGARMENKK